MGLLGAEDLGEVKEFLRACDFEIGDRGLLKENDSNEGDLGDLGVRGVAMGGCGAGLGLMNRSGSSATISKPGLNGGVMG